jgi:hypothetical protein
VLSIELARLLRDGGVRWTPSAGDRFVIPGRGIDDDVFHLAEMTVDVHQFPSGPVIGFNGTTEWALDSVLQEDTLWLPREDQLRRLLGGSFRALERSDGQYRVRFDVAGRSELASAHDVEEAYALAVLQLVRAGTT